MHGRTIFYFPTARELTQSVSYIEGFSSAVRCRLSERRGGHELVLHLSPSSVPPFGLPEIYFHNHVAMVRQLLEEQRQQQQQQQHAGDDTYMAVMMDSSSCAMDADALRLDDGSKSVTEMVEQPRQRLATERADVSWMLPSAHLLDVASSFDGEASLFMEVEGLETGMPTSILFYAHAGRGVGGGIHVARLGVLHDLGPNISVDVGGIDAATLIFVDDVRGFCDMAKAVATLSEEPSCRLRVRESSSSELHPCWKQLWLESQDAQLRLHMDLRHHNNTKGQVGSSTKDDGDDTPLMMDGEVRCDDLQAFATLCRQASNTRMGRSSPPTLRVGCSSAEEEHGLAMLHLQWLSDCGPRIAYLFFTCRGG